MSKVAPLQLALRGIFTPHAPLGQQSWFRCGGVAEMLFEPADQDDLQDFLKEYEADQPLHVVGGLANTIVRDGGVPGIVVRLGKPFADIHYDESKNVAEIKAGAGALNGSLASAAAKAGIGGFEFLSGIPGTLGGAIAMNAGAYGSEMRDILVEVYALSRNGDLMVLKPEDLHMRYRHCELPEGAIVVGAVLKGVFELKETVKQRLKDIKAKRNATQPIRENTGGSTFANPSPDLRAWQVVEKVGGRDLKIGGASMSDMHLNFMVNNGHASAGDLEALGDTLQAKALEALGVELRWEIQRIGLHA